MKSTVKNLKKLLSEFDDDFVVYLSIDDEGNMYHPVDLDDVGSNYKNKHLFLYPHHSGAIEGD